MNSGVLRRAVFAAPAFVASFCLVTLVSAQMAFASSSGDGLPWETPLQTFTNSIKGPVAFAFSLLGIVACGAALIWGGEISEFIRRAVMLVLVIALLVLATNVMSTLFSSGAVIG